MEAEHKILFAQLDSMSKPSTNRFIISMAEPSATTTQRNKHPIIARCIQYRVLTPSLSNKPRPSVSCRKVGGLTSRASTKHKQPKPRSRASFAITILSTCFRPLHSSLKGRPRLPMTGAFGRGLPEFGSEAVPRKVTYPAKQVPLNNKRK
ncbi:hypothetical protein V2G26_008651 [Clonostachys chloroleuca]